MFGDITQLGPLYFIIVAWSLLWKGLALWRAGRNEQRIWFMAILLVNTFGILEIAYLFWFAKKRLTLSEIKGWKNLLSSSARSK